MAAGGQDRKGKKLSGRGWQGARRPVGRRKAGRRSAHATHARRTVPRARRVISLHSSQNLLVLCWKVEPLSHSQVAPGVRWMICNLAESYGQPASHQANFARTGSRSRSRSQTDRRPAGRRCRAELQSAEQGHRL